MRRIVLCAMVAAGLGFAAFAAQTSKSWPADYWDSMVAAEAAQRPKAATETLSLADARGDVTCAASVVPALDTFLSGLFASANSVTGLSTLPLGFLYFLR